MVICNKPEKVYILLLLIVFIISACIFQTGQNNGLDDLDYSWQYSLNYAVSHRLVFGTDVIFTYGPLGFLGYLVTAGLSAPILILCWSIRIIFLSYILVYLYDVSISIIAHESKDVSALVKYCLWPYAIFLFGRFDYTLLIAVVLVHLHVLAIAAGNDSVFFKFFRNKRTLLYISTAATTALMFYVKVSYMPFLIVLITILIISFLVKNEYKELFTYLTTLTFIFVVIYGMVSINLHYYVVNSFQVISGYRSAMQLYKYNDYFKYYHLYIVAISLAVYTFTYFKKYLFGAAILVALLVLIFIYYTFTYSFTRGWEGGYIFNPPVIILYLYMMLYVIENARLKVRFKNVMIIIMVISTVLFAPTDVLNLPSNVRHIFSKNKLPDRINSKYLDHNNSYDAYPFEASICKANDLKYSPRRTIQSYTDYTSTLDSITSAFFAKRKLDHIIFYGNMENSPGNINAIDNRYFMFDEPRTKLEILKNYEMHSCVNDSMFITSLRAKEIKTSFSSIINVQGALNKVIDVPILQPHDLLYFTVDFKYKKFCKLSSLVKRMPHIQAEIVLNNGNKFIFNVVSDLLSNKCILNKYCNNYREYFSLFDTTLAAHPNPVKSIKFYAKQNGYEDKFVMKIYRLERS